MIGPDIERVTIIRPCKVCGLGSSITGCDVRRVWADCAAGVTPGAYLYLTWRVDGVARESVPSEMNQFLPHAGNHIPGVILKNSPAFHKRLRILFIP